MKDLIEANPAVMMGKPVVRGTRITVELILEKLAAGETIDQLLAALTAHGSDMFGEFTVISPGLLRIRSLSRKAESEDAAG